MPKRSSAKRDAQKLLFEGWRDRAQDENKRRRHDAELERHIRRDQMASNEEIERIRAQASHESTERFAGILAQSNALVMEKAGDMAAKIIAEIMNNKDN